MFLFPLFVGRYFHYLDNWSWYSCCCSMVLIKFKVIIFFRNHWSLLIMCHFGESLESKIRAPCMLLLDSLQMVDPKRLEPNIRKYVFLLMPFQLSSFSLGSRPYLKYHSNEVVSSFFFSLWMIMLLQSMRLFDRSSWGKVFAKHGVVNSEIFFISSISCLVILFFWACRCAAMCRQHERCFEKSK